MKGEIVFINQSAGYLMIDIVNQFKDDFEKRVLVTGFISKRNTPLDADVKIEKIIPYSRKNILYRSMSWVVGFIQILYLVLTRHRGAYLFFVTNPPLAAFIPLFTRNKYSFLIYDIYPDTLFKYKKLSPGSFIGKFWKRVNTKVFNKAESIFTISEGMKAVIKTYAPETEVKVVPIWADNNYFEITSKSENPFVQRYGLENKFIVLYSGNLGITHDIEALVEVANIINRSDVFFLIIGNGEKEDLIRKGIENYKLDNCMLLPLQPVDMLPFTLGSASIGVVATGKDAGNLSVPSKAFSLMAAGIPLLCISEPDAELSRIVHEFEIGKSFVSSDIFAMAEFICKLADDKQLQKEYHNNLKRAAANFDKSNARAFLTLKK
jgi:glycosyltransferase involved in cell wall biosynthesis